LRGIEPKKQIVTGIVTGYQISPIPIFCALKVQHGTPFRPKIGVSTDSTNIKPIAQIYLSTLLILSLISSKLLPLDELFILCLYFGIIDKVRV